MKWIFNPAIRLGNQLSFKYKFLLWSCLMLLPLAYSMANLLGRLQDDNEQARKELAGVINLTPVPAIEQALLTHRNLVTQHAYEQNPMGEDKVKAAAQAVDDSLRAFADTRQDNPAFDALKQGWATLQSEGSKLEVDQSNLRHDKLLTEVRHLYKNITAASSLIQDPALGTYYMVILTSERLPQLRDLLAQVRDRAATIADFGLFQAEGYSGLRFRLDLINATLQELEADLTLLYQIEPAYRAELGQQTDALLQQVRQGGRYHGKQDDEGSAGAALNQGGAGAGRWARQHHHQAGRPGAPAAGSRPASAHGSQPAPLLVGHGATDRHPVALYLPDDRRLSLPARHRWPGTGDRRPGQRPGSQPAHRDCRSG
nr:hypothetical protein [Aeromonas veronii]